MESYTVESSSGREDNGGMGSRYYLAFWKTMMLFSHLISVPKRTDSALRVSRPISGTA